MLQLQSMLKECVTYVKEYAPIVFAYVVSWPCVVLCYAHMHA